MSLPLTIPYVEYHTDAVFSGYRFQVMPKMFQCGAPNRPWFSYGKPKEILSPDMVVTWETIQHALHKHVWKSQE